MGSLAGRASLAWPEGSLPRSQKRCKFRWGPRLLRSPESPLIRSRVRTPESFRLTGTLHPVVRVVLESVASSAGRRSPPLQTGCCSTLPALMCQLPVSKTFPVTGQCAMIRKTCGVGTFSLRSRHDDRSVAWGSGRRTHSGLAGAGDGDRTRDVQLGKLAFYR
jgi:hypothetical protein